MNSFKEISLSSSDQEAPEFYFSCHEKLINSKNQIKISLGSSASLISDPRNTISLPNLSRTTLMDQIDYSLAELRLNEFSSSRGNSNNNQITNLKLKLSENSNSFASKLEADQYVFSLTHIGNPSLTPTRSKVRMQIHHHFRKIVFNLVYSAECEILIVFKVSA